VGARELPAGTDQRETLITYASHGDTENAEATQSFVLGSPKKISVRSW